MPVLPAETQWFPETLLDESNSALPPGHRWWVFHVRPRQEKSLARELHKKQVPFFLPLISRRWRSNGRLMTSHVPLFAGYVFSRSDHDGRLAALSTGRIVHSLDVADQDQLCRDLKQIHRLLLSGTTVTPESRLTPGTAVEIGSGPLMGMRGKIIRRASGRRFLVEVDFIRRGASVLLDDYVLTKVI
jgi:transcription antitermination factor NusG